MQLALLRLVRGKNFPLGQPIIFTAFWCGDEGRTGRVTPVGSEGVVNIYEEIAFNVEDDDERLIAHKSTVLCLSYWTTEHLFDTSKPRCVARMTVDLADGIKQKFCVFPAHGQTGVLPHVQVFFGLESFFIPTRSPKILTQAKAKKDNKKRVHFKDIS